MDLMRSGRSDFDEVMEYTRSPKAFLGYMDRIGIDRAVLINSASPEVTGFPPGMNVAAAQYARANPRRLLASGSIHPRHTDNVLRNVEEFVRLGLRLLKIHPPHQCFYANEYLNGLKELEILYRACEANGIPVMFHTGTSIFPGARNKYGDPIYVDDVAVDFPKLQIILAHGGRPLWTDTAFFLLRRHSNVYLDISSIPPSSLLKYFPRLEEIAHKTLFGSDWPGPGIVDIRRNLDDVSALPLSDRARQRIFGGTALEIWPA